MSGEFTFKSVVYIPYEQFPEIFNMEDGAKEKLLTPPGPLEDTLQDSVRKTFGMEPDEYDFDWINAEATYIGEADEDGEVFVIKVKIILGGEYEE